MDKIIKEEAIGRVIDEGEKVLSTLNSAGWKIIENEINRRIEALLNEIIKLSLVPNETEKLRLKAIELDKMRIMLQIPKDLISDYKQAFKQSKDLETEERKGNVNRGF